MFEPRGVAGGKALGVSALRDLAGFVSVQAYYSLVGRDVEREPLPMIDAHEPASPTVSRRTRDQRAWRSHSSTPATWTVAHAIAMSGWWEAIAS